MLKIENLNVSIDGCSILNGLSLQVEKGEIHAIMGPNGTGKSTFAKVISGHPDYEVTGGQILFCGKNLLTMEPEERVALGMFMSFQYPIEIPGVSNFQFLYTAFNAQRKARGDGEVSKEVFEEILKKKMVSLDMKDAFINRNVNEGFSGGEKKRNEILQMILLDPKLAILDETDSGLDIDAMRIVAKGVNTFMQEDRSLILITHYQRLLDYIKPDVVHVMVGGKIVKSGDASLALELEERGYEWLVGEKR